MKRSGRVLAAAALCAAVLLGGCDGGEDPSPTPTSESPSPEEPTTAETSDAPTPPEVEAPTPAPEASTDDHAGAIWATRYFLDLYAYMRQTGDTAQFEAMSASGCQFCASSVENANEIHDAGGWVEGGELVFDINEAGADYPTDDEPSYLVRFSMTEEPFVVHRGDGSIDEMDGGSGDVVVALQFVDARFVVVGVNYE